MAQTVRSDEVARLVAVAKRFAATQPADVALLGGMAALLREVADQHTRADTALAVIDAATHASRHRLALILPEAERRVWEDAGAQFDPQAIAVVEAATAAAFADLLDRSLIGDGAAAERLRVDRSRISQRVSDRSLYAFSGPGEDRCFPRWQFTASKTLPALKVVLGALDSQVHPLAVDHWATTPSVDLQIEGRPASPVAWLATGGSPDRVVDLVADL